MVYDYSNFREISYHIMRELHIRITELLLFSAGEFIDYLEHLGVIRDLPKLDENAFAELARKIPGAKLEVINNGR